MFPLDDMDVMTNLDELCQFCGSQVEYIVVKNPARAARTKMFDGSLLDAELKALGATIITLPLLSGNREDESGLSRNQARARHSVQ